MYSYNSYKAISLFIYIYIYIYILLYSRFIKGGCIRGAYQWERSLIECLDTGYGLRFFTFSSTEIQDSSKGGAVEAGCSGFHYIIGNFTI